MHLTNQYAYFTSKIWRNHYNDGDSVIEFLPILAFFTSFLTAIAGLGGGVLLIAVMVLYMPPQDAIPIHGMVQLYSNCSRALFLRKNIHWRYCKEYVIGGVFGAVFGVFFEPTINYDSFMLILAIFILVVTWLPLKSLMSYIPGGFISAGCLQVYLSLFVGAGGPLSSALLIKEDINHKAYVGTNAVLTSVMHFLKILVFIFLGFSFYPYTNSSDSFLMS